MDVRSLPRLALTTALLGAVAVALAARLAPAQAAPTELFFSEYVEGSSSNKALELFNGTGAPVTLTGVYDVQIFANGSATATATIPLTGTVADGDVFVLAQVNAVAAVVAHADQTTANFLYNGDDAIALRRAGTIVDVIGQIGLDPGGEWGSGDTSTADATLRRKPGVHAGDADGAGAFDPAVEWDGHALDTFDGLGAHTVSASSNTAPVCGLLALETSEDLAVETAPACSDADGDPLEYEIVAQGAIGAASAAAGLLRYAPGVDEHGSDSFSYRASDGESMSAAATVTVAIAPVNDDPEPEDDAASVAEAGSLEVEVAANDTDPDGDPLTVTAVGAPLSGAASIGPFGRTVVYVPEPDFSGTEVLEYAVSDGAGGADTAELVITVAAVNDPPRPVADATAVAPGAAVVVDVLANDSAGPADEAGQTLAVISVGVPARGAAEIVADGPDAGKVRYTAPAGASGADSFTYLVSDGEATAAGAVTITVTEAVLRTLCALEPTIDGTAGDDVIVGTAGDDVIRGRRGADTIDGGGGNDVVCGGPGADRIVTGDGSDRIAAGTGSDTVDSGAGDDRVRGGFGADTITTEAGDDRIAAGPGADDVDAGEGRNSLALGPGDDRGRAGGGDDRVDGGPGTDTCDAGGGANAVLRCE
ncbi:MAG: tandem-95 repeat protein [Thermoleophilia bacterium]|nr:tandem-95 repeat protein [Thermoleophilia bacterium]